MTNQKSFLTVFLLLVALVLNACAPVLTSVVVRTDPPGGEVRVSDQQVTDGNAVQLPPGSWDFVSTLEGYRDGYVVAKITEEPGNVTVPLGAPFGRLIISVTPPDAVISVSPGPTRKGPELVDEFAPGPYVVTFTHPDYPRVTRQAEVETGWETTLQVEMADTAPLTITTDDHQAAIFVDGARVGKGAELTVGVSKGMHTVSVVHTLNGWQRLYAKQQVLVEHEQGTEMTLRPESEQWLFEGLWLAAADARRREVQRFERQAVQDTAITRVQLGLSAKESLERSGVLPEVLHYSMRVGDQVIVSADNQDWVFTKRNSSMGAAFKVLGQAFNKSRTLTLPWRVGEPLYELNAQINRDPVVALATAVVRTRLALPLTRPTAEELNADGVTVNRNMADGLLLVVVSGGEDVEVNGDRMPGDGMEKALQVATGNSMVNVKWTGAPEAIAILSTRKLNQLDWRSWESLLRGDKRLGAAFAAGQVTSMERVSQGPEYPETTTELFEATGPLAAEMNLHMIDLGPHEIAGEYHRSWRFDLLAGGVTQRQLDLRYQVSEESLRTDTHNFLRRETDSTN